MRPISTYRIQLTPELDFAAAAAIIPYLHELGVTHLYLSPPFEAAPGSTHGYDVINHNRFRPELGGEEGFAALARAAQVHSMGILLDFVPNHVGIGFFNPQWMDVLENGPSSLCARYFDIEWHPTKLELANKVLVPVLGDQYGAVLERGELRLREQAGAFFVDYFDQYFPIAPKAVPTILEHRLETLTSRLGPEDVHLHELLSIITALKKLAPRHIISPDAIAERAREKEVAKRRLERLMLESEPIRHFVHENVAVFNGATHEPRSMNMLDALLGDQAYRLAHWRVAGEEVNYRRFFDINALAALRMEDDVVFTEAHELMRKLVNAGQICGVRIDHPDGLYQPTAYFRRLWSLLSGGAVEPYVIVEKILEADEPLPASWQVDGTTGYEFLNLVDWLFVDSRNERALSSVYARFIGQRIDYTALVYEKKKLVTQVVMASEINMLASRLNRISEADRMTRDFTLNALTRALVEYVACLPIYRTYVEGETANTVDPRDRRYIESTLAAARQRARALDPSIFAFLREVLLLEHPERLPREARRDRVELARKLQQVTGPVTAKAVEDTAFYIYNRLISLNEVGGNPKRFGCDVPTFHARMAERQGRWPGSLNTTTTHDTKRSEDVRTRISMLSEIPVAWGERIRAWNTMNRPYRTEVEGEPAPRRNDEYLLYQTLIGSFPDDGGVTETFIARIAEFMQKAAREAKVVSSWINPHVAYEEALTTFARGVLTSGDFLADFVPFQRRIAHAGRISALAQVALKCCAPGIPDVYQGSELWNLSLVDPDNRRPVDFKFRRALLRSLRERGKVSARGALLEEVSTSAGLVQGQAKLLLLSTLLHLRRNSPALFHHGAYLPLPVEGRHADHLVAFARKHENDAVVCIVPRLVVGLLGETGMGRFSCEARIALPENIGPLEDVLTGATLPHEPILDAGPLLGRLPVIVARSVRR